MKFFLGIDIGTSNIKNILFDENWNEVFSVSVEVLTIMSPNGYCEQDPLKIIRDVDLLLEQTLGFAMDRNLDITAIGLSSAMHSFMAVNDDFSPLSDLIIWSDTRAFQYSKKLKEDPGFANFMNSMNVPVHPMLPLVKWLWYLENGSGKVFKVLALKDYLIWHWFGQCITDVSLAASTGYFNIHSLSWNTDLLAALNLSADMLPEVTPTTKILTQWTASCRSKFSRFHLPPVVLGSSDGCLANLAAGVVDETSASITLGTSGAVRTATSMPSKQGTGMFCYPVFKNYYVTGGATNNGGNVLQWFNLSFDPDNKLFWKALEEVIENRAISDGELLFIPYIFGERAPLWDPEIKGAYFGISNMHTKQHFLKASVEGVAFSLKHVLNNLLTERKGIDYLIADGGFTKSEPWVQLVCDVLGVKIEVPETSYGAAKGAAMLASMALSEKGLAETANRNGVKKTYHPDSARNTRYESLFTKYLSISDFLVQLNRG